MTLSFHLTFTPADLSAMVSNNNSNAGLWSRLRWATPSDLEQLKVQLMSVISDFAAKQAAFNKRQSDAIDSAVASVSGLSGDIQSLNDKITELQNSVGQVTPEDQALIDDLETKGDALSTKAEALSQALTTLDNLTPPNPPTGG